MKTYTKEQLIAAQQKYNDNYSANPDEFKTLDELDENSASNQIDYLLSLVED